MAFERYDGRIVALANLLHVGNPVGANGKRSLDENGLLIQGIRFYDQRDRWMTTVDATDKNKGGRLFFQPFAARGIVMVHLFNPLLRQEMANYFQELWEEALNPERILMSALRSHEYAKFLMK
jgi:hypothetical protein